jgi:predicted nucleotide-binding protein
MLPSIPGTAGGTVSGDWWLIGNAYFGTHVAQGDTAKEAKADVRERIAATFADEGMSKSACIRASSSYRVFVIAGHLAREEAEDAQHTALCDDWEPALRLAQRHRNRRTVARLSGPHLSRGRRPPS